MSNMYTRDFVGFAKECTGRATKWLNKYLEQGAVNPKECGSQMLAVTPWERARYDRERRRKLELSVKNLNAAIAEIEVEMAYLDEEIKNNQ